MKDGLSRTRITWLATFMPSNSTDGHSRVYCEEDEIVSISGLISNVHWFAVIVMTVSSFALGALWHAPFMFGRLWTKENYPNGMNQNINVPLLFGGTAIVNFIALMSLSAIVSGHGLMYGLLAGFLVSVVWIVPTFAGTYLFANRSLKLLAIDAGMYVVLFSLSGLILGVW